MAAGLAIQDYTDRGRRPVATKRSRETWTASPARARRIHQHNLPGAGRRSRRATARVAHGDCGLMISALFTTLRLTTSTAPLMGLASRLLPFPGLRWGSVWLAPDRVAGGLVGADFEEKIEQASVGGPAGHGGDGVAVPGLAQRPQQRGDAPRVAEAGLAGGIAGQQGGDRVATRAGKPLLTDKPVVNQIAWRWAAVVGCAPPPLMA